MEGDEMINTPERINNLYKVNTIAGWAKNQLKILAEMLEDRVSEVIKEPLSQEWLLGEVTRVKNGLATVASYDPGVAAEPQQRTLRETEAYRCGYESGKAEMEGRLEMACEELTHYGCPMECDYLKKDKTKCQGGDERQCWKQYFISKGGEG
jgi:hypothetical protein